MAAGDIFSLDGRVALITGASSGLGRRFAEVAAANGASVVLVARRMDRLEALEAAIAKAGGRALAVQADVTDRVSMGAAFEAAERRFGTVDLFVANAGVGVGGPPSSVTEEGWRTVMTTNLDAVFFSCQDAAARMAAAGRPGSIITIASIGGIIVPMGLSAYGIAKSAVIQATRLLAGEFGKHGIRVNCIAPGWVMTEMSADYLGSPEGEAMGQRLPLGRFGQPDDLDGPFLLLASEAGRFMTGVTLVVDGGQILHV